jgi:cell division protein FtsI/penicillin-binding protein 2
VQVKTGTAEFDNNPANTHAWTIGWQGDIAFAVFVENGRQQWRHRPSRSWRSSSAPSPEARGPESKGPLLTVSV